jgi:hypothetical protein
VQALHPVTDEDDFVQIANYAGRRAALRRAVQQEGKRLPIKQSAALQERDGIV